MEPLLTKRQKLVLRTLHEMGKVSILDLHEHEDVGSKMTLRKLDNILGRLRVWGYVSRDWPKRYWCTPKGIQTVESQETAKSS